MTLKNNQIKYLRGIAHSLKPIVLVGQAGASAAVIAEIEQALSDHELLKIKITLGDRQLRDAAIDLICESTGAHKVQRIGNTLVIFRRNPDKAAITLPR